MNTSSSGVIATLLLSINQHTEFGVPSLVDSKDKTGAPKAKR